MALAGCAAALAMTIAACGDGDENGSSAASGVGAAKPASTVEIMYTYDELFTKPIKSALEDLPSQGITPKLVLAGKDYEDLSSRTQADIAAGNAPDLTQVPLNRLPQLVEAGVVEAIDDLMEKEPEFAEQFDPTFLELGQVEGKQYGLPYAVSTPLLFYNAEAFKEAGLDAENPPQTYSEIKDAAQKIVESGAARYGYLDAWDGGAWTFDSEVQSGGGSMLNEDGTAATFNEEPGVRVLSFWTEMVDDRLMPLLTDADGQAAFARGDVAMSVQSTARVASLESQADFTVKTTTMPVPDGGQRKTPGAGNAWVILAEDPAERAAAWEALKKLVGPQGSSTVTKATGYMPVNRVARETPELLGDFYEKNPNYRTSLEHIPTLTKWTAFPGTRGVEIQDTLTKAFQSAMERRVTPQEALDDAARKVDELIAP